MKRNILIGISLILLLIINSCSDEQIKLSKMSFNEKQLKDFIYIDGNSFKLKGKDFFPIMINYVVDLRTFDGKTVISPVLYYERTDEYESNSIEENYKQISNHFKLIKQLGFNSIRLVFDRISYDSKTKTYSYMTTKGAKQINDRQDEMVESLSKVVSLAKENGLYVMILLHPCFGDDFMETYNAKILKTFSEEPFVFAYDFMNEPLYTDDAKFRPKGEAVNWTRHWRDMMIAYAPDQLFTVGSSEPLEVFEWDPSLLAVDFIQIHTYHPLRVKNEIYWYSKYVNRPWMIGETSLPADNDSITYEEQRQFVKETYQYARDCGCMGFGFWEFQDNPYSHEYEGQYTGLMNHEGTTTLDDGTVIVGTVKPTAKEFKNFNNYRSRRVTEPPVNYKNMIGLYNIKITGWVYDHATNKPIEGAVFRAWTDDWSIGINTYTNEYGEFTLYTNDVVTHFECSACGMSNFCMTKNLSYVPATSENYDINNLPEKKLDYHHRSYMPLLKDDAELNERSYNYIFNFDEEKFCQYKFTSDFGLFVIEKMPICD